MADHDQAPTLAAPAAPGDVIAGKYRIDGVLGTGGMGIVFAATHLHLERLVAVKVMRAGLAEFPGAVERLVLEAKLAARLRSEHACKVLDVGTLPDGAPYVVMEYLEGCDLATMLGQQGAFPTSAAVDFILEACEALAEAHALEIVHRDLKPENLFVARALDGTDTIKVLDFGISKQRGPSTSASRNLTNASAALGSPNYMPPEQMRSPKDVDARADIWSVGAILYEMLTGRQAFPGETMVEVCLAVVNSSPAPAQEIRPDLPRRLVQVVERCLAKSPDDRFADVSELAAELAPFGSTKAPISLARIERVLSGAHTATLTNTSLPGTPVSRPVTPGAASALRRETTATITTGAAVALLGDRQRRRRPVVILGVLALLGAGGAIAMSQHGKLEPIPVPVPAEVPQAAAMTVTKVAPVASPLAVDSAIAATMSPEPPRPTDHKPSAVPASLPRRSARPRTLAPPPSAARPTAASAPVKPSGVATGAWDLNNFGPRR
jgi:serine/threonine-protein kinase